jgi:hypothetical protein
MSAITLTAELARELGNQPRYPGGPGHVHSYAPPLKELLQRSPDGLNVVEWGPGQNTGIFLRSGKVKRLISFESDAQWFEKYRSEFSEEIASGQLDLRLIPFDPERNPKQEIISLEYNPRHAYVESVLMEFGENFFDIAFIDGGGYRTDCTELAELIVCDGGLILWHDIVSWRDNKPEYASGRRYQDVFTRFPEYHYLDRHRTLLIVNRKESAAYSGMPVESRKMSCLHQAFSALEAAEVEFIVLRNADKMPLECSIAKDIDLFIPPEDLQVAKKVLTELGWKYFRDSTPENYLYQASPHEKFQRTDFDLHLDVVTGLFYLGLTGKDRVSIHRGLQQSLRERCRVTQDFWRYTPHLHDHFLHILCHCLYDKQKVPAHYGEALFEMLSLTDRPLLEKETESLLYRFAPRALSLIEMGQASELPAHYLAFSEY